MIYRNTIGRLFVWRESRAYERLAGIKGTPFLYGKVDCLALVMSKVPGRNLEEVSGEERLERRFFRCSPN
jgi:hypothetical protein